MVLMDDDPNENRMSRIDGSRLYDAYQLFKLIQTALDELPYKALAVALVGRNGQNELIVQTIIGEEIFGIEKLVFDQLGERFEVVVP